MKNKLIDSQIKDYENLLGSSLASLVAAQSTQIDDRYKIDYRLFPIDLETPVIENKTEYYMAGAEVLIQNLLNESTVRFNVDLLKIPVLQELGFKINGNFMQFLDEYERATGWYFIKSKVDSKGKFSITTMALGQYGKTFSFVYIGNKLIADFSKLRTSKESAARKKVPAGVFLRAISGLSTIELMSKFGYDNPYVVMALEEVDGMTYEQCVDDLINALVPSNSELLTGTLQSKVNTMNRIFFSKNYFAFDTDNAKRFEHLQSFRNRAKGSLLARDVNAGGRTYKKGTILDNDVLDELDALPVDTLEIVKNDQRYTIRKFTTLTFRALGGKLVNDIPEIGLVKGKELTFDDLRKLNDSDLTEMDVRFGNVSSVHLERRKDATTLQLDDIYTAFAFWLDNVNGLGVYDKTYELNNRVCQSVSKIIERMIVKDLNYITRVIRDQAHLISNDESMSALIGDFSKGIKTDDFIDRIKDQKAGGGQMSEMCNILAYSSKNNKIFTKIKQDNITDDMIQVQDTQEGRLDPFDVPESGKIGSVHNKTMMAEYNEAGELLSPYLEVRDGEIVSDEPVYLAVSEELGKYIAQWDETFLNEDGTKKDRVRARIDGQVVQIETSRVSYKEYSNLQSMSVSHALVTFPGHTNAKRITMACNEWRQALMTVKPERPFVGTGAESIIDFGTYTARDVLRRYYDGNVSVLKVFEEYEDLIMNSPIKLTGIRTIKDFRELTFTVVDFAPILEKLNLPLRASCTLQIPYMLRNFQESVFSFRINHVSNRTYQGDDIVAYNTGYSLDKKEREDLIDYGAYSVEDGQFDSGAALGHNIPIAYKTYESSTIDDACTISDELIYDDTLTHVRLILKEDEERSDSNSSEQFGIDGQSSIFDGRGLPKIGTVLEPGDRCISKVVTYNGGKKKVKYKTLSMYESGQVVRAEIINKNGKNIAQVLLANRAAAEVGDKLVGRHGNKGVIAQVVPAHKMPFDPKTGRRIQILLNPLGVPSRQNISQFLEAALGMCRLIDGKQSYVSPYVEGDLDFVKKQMEEFDVHPVRLIDGRTGQYFKRPVNVGVLYMAPLQQTAISGIHAIGLDAAVDPIFLQPRKGSKNNGGQSFGEMENWCLHGVCAYKLLQDLYGFQSDDVFAREQIRNKIAGARNAGTADAIEVEVDSNNSNTETLLAMLRSLGVTLITEDDEYYLRPMTDAMTRALNILPVQTIHDLHSPIIFGGTESIQAKTDSKSKWSWIHLNTEMIHPLWLRKNPLGFAIALEGEDNGKTLSSAVIKNLLTEKAVVIFGGHMPFYLEKASVNYDNYMNELKDFDTLTGIPAIVRLYKETDLQDALNAMEGAFEKKKDSTRYNPRSSENRKARKRIQMLKSFIDSGMTLSDFVITTFPIMPVAFRPEIELSNVGNMSADFDHHYKAILNAAKKVGDNGSTGAIHELYDRLLDFTGVKSKSNGNGQEKFKSVLNFFAGSSSNDHGAMRTHAQSKRIFCSGRTTITPASYRISPMHLGVPIHMLVVMGADPLAAFFESKKTRFLRANSVNSWSLLFNAIVTKNKKKFDKIYNKKANAFRSQFSFTSDTAFSIFKEWIIDFFEGRNGCKPQVIISGRQPSLHRFSIRAYHIVVLDTLAIQINPLVCKGYNADFDGDKMWVEMPITESAKTDAITKISPEQDMLNPKNSSVILEHSQDIALGCYVATMLKDNATTLDKGIEDALYYDNISLLRSDVENGLVEPWDLVCYSAVLDSEVNHYLSTAGRILFNDELEEYGFTDKPFTNPLNIAGIDPENNNFKELAYDGLITSGKGGDGEIKYINLQNICKDLYMECNSRCIKMYYNIELFGFKFSDMFSVTLGLEDLDIESGREDLLNDANDKKQMIMQDFRDGLISEADKRTAIIALYTDEKVGVNQKIQKNLMSNLKRNDNLFIMVDSGARGNATQVMHTCGSIGVLEKTKVDSMEDSVETNYYKGLNSLDIHMVSYSARIGVASSQRETRNAGYATRKVIYMTDGTKIVENDCGKTDWWYDATWDERIEKLSVFKPSRLWFNDHLLGKVVDGAAVTEEDFEKFHTEGFNSVKIEDSENSEILKADPYILEGYGLEKEDGTIDSVTRRYFSKLVDTNGKFNFDCITSLDKHKLMSVTTAAGTFECRYKLSRMCRSQLMYREARELEHLKVVKVGDSGETISVITEPTLDWIEENGISRIPARIMLDCKSKHGICAHCYGLKYSTLRLPEVGEMVGTEAAQAIGEPSAQLTLNVINKGGAAGSSIASGIDIFDAYLRGGALGGKNTTVAEVPETSGHVMIRKVDSTAVVAVMPESTQCNKCQMCISNTSLKKCPLSSMSEQDKAMCILEKKIPMNTLTVKNGEWVDSGYPITDNPFVSDSIVSVKDSTDPRIVLRHKQMVWVANYFEIFTSQGIFINARHFEILAMVQNQYGTIIESNDPRFEEGASFDVKDLEDLPDGVVVDMQTTGMDDVIAKNSGLLTSLTFAEQAKMIATLTATNTKSSFKYNTSPIGKISVGQDLTSPVMKYVSNPVKMVETDQQLDTSVNQPIEVINLDEELGSMQFNAMDAFDGLDNFASFDLNSIETEEKEDLVPKITPVQTAKADNMSAFDVSEVDASEVDDFDYEEEDYGTQQFDDVEPEPESEPEIVALPEPVVKPEDFSDFEDEDDFCTYQVLYYLDGVVDESRTVFDCEPKGSKVSADEIEGYELQSAASVTLEVDSQVIKFLYSSEVSTSPDEPEKEKVFVSHDKPDPIRAKRMTGF